MSDKLLQAAAMMAQAMEMMKDAGPRAFDGNAIKAISGTPTGVAPYGPGGIFGTAGLDQTIINAHMSPSGIDSLLPVYATVETSPLYPAITGWGADWGDEADGVCDDCAGNKPQTCIQTATFGRICRETEEMEINEIIQRINRGVMTDLRILGSVLGNGPFQPVSAGGSDWIRTAVHASMVSAGISLQRKLSQMIWTGNPANNSAGGGYKEFPGLDMLIATGKQDAETGALCAALDPDVKSFNYNDVCGSTVDIVEYISMMEIYLRHNAERMGLMPATWVLAMRPELFFELTACWPCKYLTYRCGDEAPNASAVINDNVNVNLRDQMRNGNYLLVNGRQIPVALDDGIYESNNINDANLEAGQFASDIYFIPLTARGMPVTYWEHLDYTTARAETVFMNGTQNWWWTDGGRFMWNSQQTGWCFKLQMKTEPRLILRTPQLAGRIQDVMYSPLQHLRSPFPDDPYFVKGGKDETTPPSLWSEWNQYPRQ